MAEKPEKKEAAPPADKNAPPAAAAAPVVAAAPAKGGLKAWLPTIVALVLAPAATWAVAQFVLLPKLQKTLADDDGNPAVPRARGLRIRDTVHPTASSRENRIVFAA